MQETFRAIIAAMGGTPTSPMPSKERDYGIRRRAHHSRARRHTNGQRSVDVGGQRILSGARRQERVRGRRRAVRHAAGQESHLDDPRAARGARANTSSEQRKSDGLRWTAPESTRSMLKMLSAAPVAAGFALTEAEARRRITRRRPRADGAKDGDGVQAEVLHAARIPDGARARRSDHSRGRTVGERNGRRRARVHGLHHDRHADAADADARRAGVARPRVSGTVRQDVPRRHARLSAQRCSTTSRPTASSKPGLSHGQTFFRSFRDLTASGFWTSKIGIKDLGYIGNTVVPEWTGCPDRSTDPTRAAGGVEVDRRRRTRGEDLPRLVPGSLPRSCVDPMDAGIHPAPRVLLELHPARQLSRHRRRLPSGVLATPAVCLVPVRAAAWSCWPSRTCGWRSRSRHREASTSPAARPKTSSWSRARCSCRCCSSWSRRCSSTLAQRMGSEMSGAEPLRGYTLNLAGSMAGVAAFGIAVVAPVVADVVVRARVRCRRSRC